MMNMDYYSDEHQKSLSSLSDNIMSSDTDGFILQNALLNSEMHYLNDNNSQIEEYEEVVLSVNSDKQNLDNLSTLNDDGNSSNDCKSTNTPKDATDDESMAVEALQELGVNVTNHKSTQENDVCGESFEGHEVKTEMHSCRICGTYFSNKTELVDHVSIHHSQDKTHKCPLCPQEFQRPSSLTNHMKIHNYTPGRALHQLNVKDEIVETESIEKWTSEQFINGADSLNMFSMNVTDHVVDNIALEIDVNTTIREDPFPDLVSQDQDNDLLHGIKMENSFEIVEMEVVSAKDNTKVINDIADKRPHVCKICGIGFSRMKALVSHERLHQDSYDSIDCEETLSDENSFESHNISCAKKKSRGNFVNKSSHIVNDDSTVGTKYFEPNMSDQNAGIEDLMVKKLPPTKASKQVKHHACPDCPKQFATKQKMYRHMWIHRKKTFTCETCALTFAQQNELDEHRLSEHPGHSPYLCQECGKCFASRQGLWEHGRVHNLSGNAGQFHCTECNKKFASRQGYLIHTRTHTGERPYGCRYCWKAFRDGGTLRKHERIHTGERPHSCPLCPRAFNQKVVLREHIRWVHAANKTEKVDALFQCQLCNQVLSDREELCAHIVKHSDQIAAEKKVAASKANGPRTKNTYVKNKNIKQKKMHRGKNRISSVAMDSPPYNENSLNFSCDLCGLLFATRENLRKHVTIHI